MERVVLVCFVLQNSFAFYLTCIVIFHVLLIACYVLSLLCFVALPYFKLLFIFLNIMLFDPSMS